MACLERLESLGLVLTAQCNLRCGYCYQNAKNAQHMDWEVVRASVDLALSSDRPKVDLLFLGGEPLLEFPIIGRAVEYARENCSSSKSLDYKLITNGILLTDDTAAFLVEHRFSVQLSFDGVAEAQDFRAKGTFVVLDRLLDRLRCAYPDFYRRSLKVTITLVPATIVHLADSVDYFLGKGVQQIAISPSITHCSGWRDEGIDELEAQFARIYESSLRYFRLTGEIPLQLFRKGENDSLPLGVGRTMCGVMRGQTLVVDVDGQVHGCAMFVDSYQRFPSRFLRSRFDAMRMGDLRDPEFSKRHAHYPDAVRQAEIFHHKEKKYSSYERCDECQYFATCGVCPVSIGHTPGNSDPNRVPDFQCAFSLVSLKYRDRFPRWRDLRELVPGPARLSGDVQRGRVSAEALEEAASGMQGVE